ncbi:CBN-GES-1 protein [Aphelenchoides avenae]|nr:CBN-GES-1 protein [Aphelenchus avenae]
MNYICGIRMFLKFLSLALCVLLACLLMAHVKASSTPIVETSYGTVQGFYVEEDGFKASVFLGIPFAEPPIGNLRFEVGKCGFSHKLIKRLQKPVHPAKWSGIRIATQFADCCIPHTWPPKDESYIYSEDCLYLNIFAPAELSETMDDYPALVMVHGGSYEAGSARRYGDYQELVRKYVSKGIIVVTIQYRLGVLGFASTGDSVLPGNLGLWDQVAALKWLMRDLHNFGGDRKRITVWGYSAGSGSVSALTVSPHSRDYFAQAVEMSGSVFAAWTTSDKVIESTRQLAHVLRCNMSDSNRLKIDLKQKSPQEFYDAIDVIGSTRYDVNFVKFGPRLDGDFFPKDYPELIKGAPKKPTVIGCTQEETLGWTLVNSANSSMFAYSVPAEKRVHFGLADLEHAVRSAVARSEDLGEKADELLSDLLFNIPILWEVREKVAARWPVYLYKNAYFNQAMFPADFPVKAVYHGVDQNYAIRSGPFPFTFNDDDRSVENTLVDIVTSFVKNGEPSTKQIAWPRVTEGIPFEYINILPRPEVRQLLFNDRLRFWDELSAQYDYNIVRGVHRRQSTTKRAAEEL